MAGDETIRPQILRDLQKIGELHRLVAAHTGNRSPSRQIAFGEIVHHPRAEAAFIIQHIMRDPQPRRDNSCVMDIQPREEATRAGYGPAMLVMLKSDPDRPTTTTDRPWSR